MFCQEYQVALSQKHVFIFSFFTFAKKKIISYKSPVCVSIHVFKTFSVNIRLHILI